MECVRRRLIGVKDEDFSPARNTIRLHSVLSFLLFYNSILLEMAIWACVLNTTRTVPNSLRIVNVSGADVEMCLLEKRGSSCKEKKHFRMCCYQVYGGVILLPSQI